jgi:hypothetical protein
LIHGGRRRGEKSVRRGAGMLKAERTVGAKWLRRIPDRALRRAIGRRGRGSRLRFGRSAREEAKLAGDERIQIKASVFIAF